MQERQYSIYKGRVKLELAFWKKIGKKYVAHSGPPLIH